jgi:hypothetical protein
MEVLPSCMDRRQLLISNEVQQPFRNLSLCELRRRNSGPALFGSLRSFIALPQLGATSAGLKRKGRNGRTPSTIGFSEIFSTGLPLPSNPPTSESVSAPTRQNDYSQNKCPLPYLMSALPPIDVRSSSGSRLSPSRIGTSAKGHQATCCGSSCRGGRRLDREIARLLANAQTRVPVEEPTARLC